MRELQRQQPVPLRRKVRRPARAIRIQSRMAMVLGSYTVPFRCYAAAHSVPSFNHSEEQKLTQRNIGSLRTLNGSSWPSFSSSPSLVAGSVPGSFAVAIYNAKNVSLSCDHLRLHGFQPRRTIRHMAMEFWIQETKRREVVCWRRRVR